MHSGQKTYRASAHCTPVSFAHRVIHKGVLANLLTHRERLRHWRTSPTADLVGMPGRPAF
jgi:hypothetical protein